MEPSSPTTDPIYAGDQTGEAPDVSKSLKDDGRVVANTNQAFAICENMIYDWKKGISHAARITSKLNGERPYSQAKLKAAGKDWKTNISTGFLATECARILPRLFMPIKSAKYLTAASLPPGWQDGIMKTEYFRQAVTEVIRSWPKFNFYIKGMAREVGIFGFGFNTWLDKYEWRPTLMRMDKGFVPMGTEILEQPSFFLAKMDYKPSELLGLLKKGVDSERSEWQKDNVVTAINSAQVPVNGTLMENVRTYEELIRQSAWIYNYNKGVKVIRTWHLLAEETSGKVSHYIILADTGMPAANANTGTSALIKQAVQSAENEDRLLYKWEDKFDEMDEAVHSMVFDYGDGTIHGSWGAGQILYDMASQVEKVRCDAIDNLRMTNKIKANVPEGKNVNDVKLTINAEMVIVSGAQFAGNQAAMTVDVAGYEQLDQRLVQLAQEKIGAFVPPIPLQPSDIKAAQINAAMSKEKEISEALLENWLIQFAKMVQTMTKRLCDKETNDKEAKAFQKVLKAKLNDEEIKLLAAQTSIQSIIDFTEAKAQQKAAFAASVVQNPLFNASVAARTMADGIGDQRFTDAIVKPDGDTSDQTKAAHDQMIEMTALKIGLPVPILVTDNDWIHMQTLKPGLTQTLQSGDFQTAQNGLQHYAAHYAQGVNKKTIPKDQINSEKQWIAAAEKNIAALQQKQQLIQHQQMLHQQAMQQAHQMIASGDPRVAQAANAAPSNIPMQSLQQQPPQSQPPTQTQP